MLDFCNGNYCIFRKNEGTKGVKRFLKHRSKRWTHDGWAVQVKGSKKPLPYTVCTTRAEARQVREEFLTDLFARTEVVKVKITVEAV